MDKKDKALVSSAKAAALEVMLHNNHGPFRKLPRTAGWAYPEPYTRDMMICGLGILASKNDKLIKTYRRVLKTLAKTQSEYGHMPSLVHDTEDRGASDTTPLFLMAVGIYRKFTGEEDFLKEAVDKALRWMEYQSPTNRYLVAQLPTSDWRDEQWVLGYGLFVNTVVYSYLKFLGDDERARNVKSAMERFTVEGDRQNRHIHEGLVLKAKPYYAFWAYKVYRSERFDLLGNSMAILSGIAKPSRAEHLISWIEAECKAMRKNGDLAVELPPNFFPYIREEDPEWMHRYKNYNQPGQYHNGGIWPFICGFYIAALVAAGKNHLAEKRLIGLSNLVKLSRKADVEFGFNEWIRAQDGTAQGQDWQSWSAAMYLYAAECVEQKRALFFEDIRSKGT